MATLRSNSDSLDTADLPILRLIEHRTSESNHDNRFRDVQRSAQLQLLHRLPIEIRFRIFEFAICTATSSPTRRLAKKTLDKDCRCLWFAAPCDPQRVEWRIWYHSWLVGVQARRRALRSLARTTEPGVLSEGGSWVCGARRIEIDPTYSRNLRRENLELPFLALDKQLAVEAMDVFYGINHFWLTSREALDLSYRPEVVSRLRELTIFERDPGECLFTNMVPCDLCYDKCLVETRRLMLLRLLSGNRLRHLTLQLQAFYGQRVRTCNFSRGQQGIEYFVAATGFEHFTTWKCTDIGLYEIDSVSESCACADRGDSPCTVLEVQLRSSRLRKFRLEYHELRGAWRKALAVPSTELEYFKGKHDVMVFHWQCRHLWRSQKFPHRCERWSEAIDTFLRWVRWNIEKLQQGYMCPMIIMFEQDYLPLNWNHASIQPAYSLMPGSDARLLHYWTEEFAKGIAGNIWDNSTF